MPAEESLSLRRLRDATFVYVEGLLTEGVGLSPGEDAFVCFGKSILRGREIELPRGLHEKGVETLLNDAFQSHYLWPDGPTARIAMGSATQPHAAGLTQAVAKLDHRARNLIQIGFLTRRAHSHRSPDEAVRAGCGHEPDPLFREIVDRKPGPAECAPPMPFAQSSQQRHGQDRTLAAMKSRAPHVARRLRPGLLGGEVALHHGWGIVLVPPLRCGLARRWRTIG
jgi:hypothetical protein